MQRKVRTEKKEKNEERKRKRERAERRVNKKWSKNKCIIFIYVGGELNIGGRDFVDSVGTEIDTIWWFSVSSIKRSFDGLLITPGTKLPGCALKGWNWQSSCSVRFWGHSLHEYFRVRGSEREIGATRYNSGRDCYITFRMNIIGYSIFPW